MAISAEHYVPQVARREFSLGRAVCAWLLACAGALLYLALIFAAPLAEASGHTAVSWSLYGVFAPLCHQIAERSFYVAGHPLAVCARCAGVYAGFTLCLLLYPLVRSLRRTEAPRRGWLVVIALPCVLDFLVNFTGLWHNTHASRAITGAWLGAGAVFFVAPGLADAAQTLWRKGERREATAPARGLGAGRAAAS
ncbi:MAG: DUF2085 domain-containing protein [Acidobacteria bacterium]|nr:DUF2085 domain-containing protein [Acidobacteriota bacterium]MCA1643321.1 DUF2085 domain-containing protein [Acidobacteriota bacterium]